MKIIVYVCAVAVLVAAQITLLPYISVWGVKPDIGLVMVCLVGLLAGELEGLLVGLFVGWAMSLFSAADLAASMVAKGTVGFLAGLAGRQVAQVTPLLMIGGLVVASTLASLMTMWSLKPNDQQDSWWMIRTIVMPQACFDAVVGGLCYWVIWSRVNLDRLVEGREV
ncbi:MAG: ECF transporter S component [Nitrospira sp.]|nr:MAG: ECF transporter S component [Nitrospira sp.]